MYENQYVVFKLGESEFGIEMESVREIIPYEESIAVPDTEEIIEGIINHRGDVIPIVNLKKRFLIGGLNLTESTRIIIIRLDQMEIGLVVDEVLEIIRLNNNDVDPTPPIISGIDKKYIMGIGKLTGKRLLILINLEKILSLQEIKEIEDM